MHDDQPPSGATFDLGRDHLVPIVEPPTFGTTKEETSGRAVFLGIVATIAVLTLLAIAPAVVIASWRALL